LRRKDDSDRVNGDGAKGDPVASAKNSVDACVRVCPTSLRKETKDGVDYYFPFIVCCVACIPTHKLCTLAVHVFFFF
jgi:hypothetical protein